MFTKELELETGLKSDYWILETVHFVMSSKIIEATIALYKSKAAFKTGKSPIRRQVILIPQERFPFTNANFRSIIEAIHDTLKIVDPFFADAVNDNEEE